MEVLDPGHRYRLNTLDGETECIVQFVKREGPKYPGNVGSYPGTTMQEVYRMQADRLAYVNSQTPCMETEAVARLTEICIMLLEIRAARCHGHFLTHESTAKFLAGAVCKSCGHVECEVHTVTN